MCRAALHVCVQGGREHVGLNVYETAWEGHKTRQFWFSGESHGVAEREGGREADLPLLWTVWIWLCEYIIYSHIWNHRLGSPSPFCYLPAVSWWARLHSSWVSVSASVKSNCWTSSQCFESCQRCFCGTFKGAQDFTGIAAISSTTYRWPKKRSLWPGEARVTYQNLTESNVVRDWQCDPWPHWT